MNINLGDILAATSKRMGISNEADRILNERYSQKSEYEKACENNKKLVKDLDDMGVDTSNLKRYW